jgi:hypothetical protein
MENSKIESDSLNKDYQDNFSMTNLDQHEDQGATMDSHDDGHWQVNRAASERHHHDPSRSNNKSTKASSTVPKHGPPQAHSQTDESSFFRKGGKKEAHELCDEETDGGGSDDLTATQKDAPFEAGGPPSCARRDTEHQDNNDDSQEENSEFAGVGRDLSLLLDEKLITTRSWAKKLVQVMTSYTTDLQQVEEEYRRILDSERVESDRLDEVEPEVQEAVSQLLNVPPSVARRMAYHPNTVQKESDSVLESHHIK